MKIINFILILGVSFFVAFVASFFFIGSEENYSELIKNLLKAFSLRFIGFSILGIILLLPIIILNIAINKFASKKTKIKRLSTMGFMLILLGSFIGTTIFFS